MSSLQVDEDASAAVASAPRVTLESMTQKIANEQYFMPSGTQLTICVLTMKNGFHVVGEAAPASPENFNAELGRTFARENAIRQLWKLEGYLLRERLAAEQKD